MNYDPKEHGALCDECPLHGSVVVPPKELDVCEAITDRAVALVGEAPSAANEKHGFYYSGPDGEEVARGLKAAKIAQRFVHRTNAILCRPKQKLGDLLHTIRKVNRLREQKYRREKKTDPTLERPTPTKTPIECCAPRLEQEIEGYSQFITMGNVATEAVSGIKASIFHVRGGLTDLEGTERTLARKVLPTLSPSFVQAVMRWRHVFLSDFEKAGKWFRGEVDWVPPNVTFQPNPSQLEAFLFDPSLIYTFDIETDGIESLTANIRCLSIGTSTDVMSISVLSKDGQRRFYDPPAEKAILAVLKRFFEDKRIVKAGHNAGYYDKIVLQQHWGISVQPAVLDTMLLHRNVESELPHGLAFVGSMYTEAPSWKTDREGNKLSTQSETDKELAEYCANDVAVTARVITPLVEHIGLRQQAQVFRIDQKVQAVCADMHTAGMFVDQNVRLSEEKRLLHRRHELLRDIRGFLDDDHFNPASVFQLRDLLFEQWKLEPPLEEEDLWTGSGDLSTSDLVLRAILTDRSVDKDKREFIKLIRYYRKVQKVLGTYVVKLRPWNYTLDEDLGWDDEEDWVDRETRKRYGLVKRGIVDPRTGRMHPGYNAHVAVTGRLSSSKPINAQNFPKALRAMVVAQPGNVLVGADMDQLELRIAAARWGVEIYLNAFKTGKDPHSMTAYTVFGDAFCKAAGITPDQFDRPGPLVGEAYIKGKFEGSGDAKKMRDLSKAVQYASQYMATVETVHKLICKTEIPSKNGDGTTDLPYALMPLTKVRELRDNWLNGAKEFESGWEREIASFRRHGFLAEKVTGRRRDFLDGEVPNELVNFPIQASAAGLMNKAILELHEEIPLHKWGPGTGIINQCHDSIVVECPESEGERVAKMLEEAMNQGHESLPGVRFTASATIGTTWKQVG